MVTVARIIAILAAFGITNGFLGPSLQNSRNAVRQLAQPKVQSPFPRHSPPLHLFSEKESTDTQSAALGSADANGSGSIAINSEDKTVAIALRRTLACVIAAVCFGGALFVTFGSSTSEEFFAGYLLELSLSVDNLLVFLLLFEYFQIPSKYQNRVLNYGIIGSVMMRAIMIGAGAVAIEQYHVVLLGFAGILIFSSAQVLLGGENEGEEDLSDNMIVKFSNKFIKSTSEFDGDRFFTVQDGIRLATPMLLCTVAVELSDVVFAVDSIPAVFGVTEVRRYVICLNLR
jgi:TerC family integral membrane protein